MGLINFRIFSGHGDGDTKRSQPPVRPRKVAKPELEPLPLTLVRPAWLDDSPAEFRRNLDRGLGHAKNHGGWKWSLPWYVLLPKKWVAPIGASLEAMRPRHRPLWWSKFEIWRRRSAKWRRNPSVIITGLLVSLTVLALVLSRPPFAPWTKSASLAAWQGMSDLLVQASGGIGMKLSHLFVEGRNFTPASDIRRVVGIGVGDPILGFDLEQTKENLEKLPWVAAAVIERHLPDSVYLRLTERHPYALWQWQNRLRVIDVTGAVLVEEAIEAKPDPSRHPDAFPNHDPTEAGNGRNIYAPTELNRDALVALYGKLPVVIGKDAPTATESLILMLATEPALASRVTSATRVGGRRWNIRLDNRLILQLPEDERAVEAWSRVADLEERQKILNPPVTHIDLRQSDRVILSNLALIDVPHTKNTAQK
ncbi:MAG: FtsQ-type POTRA domain-containing protein, partial [Alphaproteobacteria bacterium]|nr:FtsQ-type POTRA domain-containing protein [Alphaproteobacteria bacterium]